jgi:hypothetical protein
LSLEDVGELHGEVVERVAAAVEAAHRRHACVGSVDAVGLLARRAVRVRVDLLTGDAVTASVRLRRGLWRDRLEIRIDGAVGDS